MPASPHGSIPGRARHSCTREPHANHDVRTALTFRSSSLRQFEGNLPHVAANSTTMDPEHGSRGLPTMALVAGAPIPIYLRFACGHSALVSLPRIRGETARDRGQRIEQEKAIACTRPCDFCPPLHTAVQQHEDDDMTTTTETAVPTAPSGQAAAPKQRASTGRGPSPLRKLSDEQELELTRLYSDTNTPVPEIAKRFKVGESSVYRISQRHGAKLRGPSAERGGRPARAAAAKQEAPRARAARGRASAGRPTRTRQRARQGGATTARQRRATTTRAAASPTARRFRVIFRGETVVQAASLRDALRRAQVGGATEIISVTQVE
jgi:transposase